MQKVRSLAPPPTDIEIRAAFVGTNFGNHDPVVLVKNGLLGVACGYWNGHTLTMILKQLKLIRIYNKVGSGRIVMTELGLRACYDWFKKEE